MRLIIIYLLSILSANYVIAQKPTPKEQLELAKKLSEQAIKDLNKIKQKAPSSMSKYCEESYWTGTLKHEVKATFSNQVVVGTSMSRLEVSFTAAFPTMNRDINTTDLNFTDDKGSGSHTTHSDGTNLLTKIKCISDCTGSGVAELHTVTIREWDNTYDIEAIAPACKGNACDEEGRPIAYEEGMTTISVSNEKLTDKNMLTGTKIVTSEMPGGFGTATATTTWFLRRVCPAWKDSYTEKRVNTLKIKMRDPVNKFIKRVNDELCVQLRVAQALRTAAVQNDLYALGRTKPGKIVTNAKAGHSKHESGMAIDVYIVKCDGTVDLKKPISKEIAKIAKEEGMEWGGDWKKFKDFPHFEIK